MFLFWCEFHCFKFVPKGMTDNKLVSIKIKAWQRIIAEQLHEQMVIKFCDAKWCHLVTMSYFLQLGS